MCSSAFFDVNATVKDTVVKPVARIILHELYFPVFCELYLAVGLCIEEYANKLETCWCHEATWTFGGGYERRREQVTVETGHSRCVWKNRMAPWWIAVGIAQSLLNWGIAHPRHCMWLSLL